MDDDDMALFNLPEDGDITSAGNRTFVGRFLGKMGIGESAGMVTADGAPTKPLVDRIRSAIFDKAYSDDDYLLDLVSEEANPVTKNVVTALTW
jgi:hypothetical protein